MRYAWIGLLLLLLVPTLAQSDPIELRESEVDFAVKREKQDDQPKSLRFLHANRNFLRSELDRLQTHRVVREGAARALTDREKFLIAYAEELSADQDSLRSAIAQAQRADYLKSAADLLAFEEHLDELEGLLLRQNSRLRSLEEDFVARQRTALALYVTGLDQGDAESIVVRDPQGDQWQISLSAAEREALRNGATAQLLHEFVEPRPTQLELSLVTANGDSTRVGTLELQPTRDRLTFVEVDLASSHDGVLSTKSWER